MRGLPLLLMGAFFPCMAHSGIATDGTVGHPLTLQGPNYLIPASLGKQVGTNLFQSFSAFDIATGESATFSGPNGIANIISRVTGGSASGIDGLLASSIPNANLVFVNPAGIVFGPHASINISGSFYASTANYVRLADGGRFDASNPGNDLLTTAPTSAFGFLGHAAPISISGSLAVPQCASIDLIGGSFNLNNASLAANSGQINIVSTASPGEVWVNASGVDTSGISPQGNVSISASSIDVSEAANSNSGSGSIYIRAGQIVLANASSILSNTANGQGGNIDLQASGEVKSEGSLIQAQTTSVGNAGQISIASAKLRLLNGGQIDASSQAGSSGMSGTINVSASDTISIFGSDANGNASAIFSDVNGSGNGGNIALQTGKITFDQGTFISSDVTSSGNAAKISLNATNSIALNGGYLSSTSSGSGNGGTIAITTPLLDVNGGNIQVNASGAGNGGQISIGVGNLNITNAGTIDASSGIHTSGNSGSITISVADSLTITGNDNVKYDRNSANYDTGIFANNGGSGEGNSISIQSGNLTVWHGGIISTGTLGKGSGKAGDLTINVNKMTIESGGVIDVSTITAGNGGKMQINAKDSIYIYGSGSQSAWTGIFADSTNSGNGSNINIHTGSLLIDNAGMITSETLKTGNAGNVSIKADSSITLQNGGLISAQSNGSGTAANISIDAGNSLTVDNASISTQALLSDGGNISVVASNLINMNSSGITATVGTGLGNGGNISLDPLFIVMNGSSITANAFGGAGGNINLVAGNFLRSANSFVTASSKLGVSGTVTVTSQFTDLNGSLVSLPMVYLDAIGLLKQRCAAQIEGRISTFVLSGRGGLPYSPDAPMPSSTGYTPSPMNLQLASSEFGCAN